MKTMKAVVSKGKDQIALEEVPIPRPRAGAALIKITTTTICGTDVHIVRGEYPEKARHHRHLLEAVGAGALDAEC